MKNHEGGSFTAATIDVMYRHLMSSATIRDIIRNNSHERWKNAYDAQDAHAELISALANKPDQVGLLELFNRNEFNFYLVKLCWAHFATKGHFYRKYTGTNSAVQHISDDGDVERIEMAETESKTTTLSLIQYERLILHFLNCDYANAHLSRLDIDIYIQFMLPDIFSGKQPNILDISKKLNYPYHDLRRRMIKIKKYLKICLQPYIN